MSYLSTPQTVHPQSTTFINLSLTINSSTELACPLSSVASPNTDPFIPSSSTSSPEPPRTPPDIDQALLPAKSRRGRPIPRKGHQKSRRGCYNCKCRRVKCSEDQPRCRNCERRGAECEYPPEKPRRRASARDAGAEGEFGSEAPSGPLRTTPALLAIEDLRFFHHFMVTAYPKLPDSGVGVWHDVAAMASEYDFLTHAILGLAAQHLTICTPSNYSSQSLRHRVDAIQLFNKALAKPCTTAADADARYAAATILTFQAAYMPDALTDFLITTRGMMVVATTVLEMFRDSIFHVFTREAYVESMRRRLTASTAAIERRGLMGDAEMEGFAASLRLVAPLCRSVAEVRYLSVLQGIAKKAETSLEEACLALVPTYALTNKMSESDFISFSNPENHTARTLLAHFFMLDHVLQTRALGGGAQPYAIEKRVMTSWVEGAARAMPSQFRRYMIWPLSVAREG